jgi:hypothetical protein
MDEIRRAPNKRSAKNAEQRENVKCPPHASKRRHRFTARLQFQVDLSFEQILATKIPLRPQGLQPVCCAAEDEPTRIALFA